MASGVYEIVCEASGKRYVGSAKDFANRWKAHRFHLMRGSHHSRHLQAAWNKHGEESFQFRVLLVCKPENAVMYEQIVMDALAPEFNVAPTAGSALGVKHTDETRQKQRIAKLGNQHTLGYRHRPESIEKLRAKQTGVPSPTKGTKRDPAAVAATAEAHRGMKRSEETRAKIAAKAKDRRWTEEAKAKLSTTLCGRKLSEEHRKTLIGNQHAAGRKQTPEERARRAASVKAAWAAKKAAGIPWR